MAGSGPEKLAAQTEGHKLGPSVCPKLITNNCKSNQLV